MMSHSLGVVIGIVLVIIAVVLAVVSVKLGTTKTTRTARGNPLYRKWGLSDTQAIVLSVLWLLCFLGYVFALVQNVLRNLEGEGILPWMGGFAVILLCGVVFAYHTHKGGEPLSGSTEMTPDSCSGA
jgi:hypothetical protein